MGTLSKQELEDFLAQEPQWKLQDEVLVRHWIFPSFVQAMGFVNEVAHAAEAAGHHPDIEIRYTRVRLGLVTHDAEGITHRDTALAMQISRLKAVTA